jgi:hypothetical protein
MPPLRVNVSASFEKSNLRTSNLSTSNWNFGVLPLSVNAAMNSSLGNWREGKLFVF